MHAVTTNLSFIQERDHQIWTGSSPNCMESPRHPKSKKIAPSKLQKKHAFWNLDFSPWRLTLVKAYLASYLLALSVD